MHDTVVTSQKCTLTNTGRRTGDEVIQVYVRAQDGLREVTPHPVPSRSLVDFERVTLEPGTFRTLFGHGTPPERPCVDPDSRAGSNRVAVPPKTGPQVGVQCSGH